MELRKREPGHHVAKPLPSRKRKARTPATSSKDTKSSKTKISKETKPPIEAEPVARVRTGDDVADRPILLVGGIVPSEMLALKVSLDDGNETSLGEQLENSHSGGLIVFVYNQLSDDEAYDYAVEFDRRKFSNGGAPLSMIGLSPDPEAAQPSTTRDEVTHFTLFRDPTCNLINALGFNFSKGGQKVGVLAVDKERNVLAHNFGKMDKVLSQFELWLDRE